MWYLMHENDQKHYVKENSDRIVTVIDPTTNKETLRVTFTPQDNGRVLMETEYPLTYIYNDTEKSTEKDVYYSFPQNREVVDKKKSAEKGRCCRFSQNREVVLLPASVETPRITVRIVRLDPQDWPVTPTPEETARAPTLPYDALVVAAPLPVDPLPLPAQEQKKSKKRRREFHMC